MATPATAPRPITTLSRFSQPLKGRQKAARRVFLYGDGGIGKSTIAAGAPRPYFLDVNQGSLGFDVERYTFDDGGRLKPETFEEFMAALSDIARNIAGHNETLVIDVLSDVEQLIWSEVVRRDGKAASIVDGNLAFNKGYEAAVDYWRRMLAVLETVWRAGVNVILIDHTDVKKEKNASGADYGRGMPKIHPTASKLIHTWSDYTFFVEVEKTLVPDSADGRKAKKEYAISDGKRILHSRTAAEWLAKARPELPDPLELPRLGVWQFLDGEIASAKARRLEELRASIAERIGCLGETEAAQAQAALSRAGDDDSKLEQLDNWCAGKARKE